MTQKERREKKDQEFMSFCCRHVDIVERAVKCFELLISDTEVNQRQYSHSSDVKMLKQLISKELGLKDTSGAALRILAFYRRQHNRAFSQLAYD